MYKRDSRHAFHISTLLLASISLLAGCVNFDPVIDKTEFHVLGISHRSSVDPVSIRVAIRDVHLADYLQNSQLVEKEGPNEIRYISQHRWAGALDSMIAGVVADELEKSVDGLYATVGDSSDAEIHLDVTVLQFFRNAGGGVSVSLEYQAKSAESNAVISEGRVTRSMEKSGASVHGSVALLEARLREAVREFAGTLN